MFEFITNIFAAVPVLMGVLAGAVAGGDKNTTTFTDNRTNIKQDHSDRRTVHIHKTEVYTINPDGQKIKIYESGQTNISGAGPKKEAPSQHRPRLQAIEGLPPSYLERITGHIKKWPLSDYIRDQASPLKITGVATGGTALSLWYFLTGARHMMRDKRQWCNWKEAIPTEDLADTEDLESALVLDIQRRYTTIQHAHDFVQPLKTFISMIDNEQAILTWYYRLGNVTHALFLGRMFGVDELSLEEAQDKLQRLHMLRRRFTNWTTGLKVTKKSQQPSAHSTNQIQSQT